MTWLTVHAGDRKPLTMLAVCDTYTRTVSVNLNDPTLNRQAGFMLDRLIAYANDRTGRYRYVWVDERPYPSRPIVSAWLPVTFDVNGGGGAVLHASVDTLAPALTMLADALSS